MPIPLDFLFSDEVLELAISGQVLGHEETVAERSAENPDEDRGEN
jgi:hypothetical protein